MSKPRISATLGRQAVTEVLSGSSADKEQLALAVRYLLQVMAQDHPGKSVELRVPPYGAVQCVEGPDHTRGTPANVVEMSAENWVRLATGELQWSELVAAGAISASGTRSDLSSQLPLTQW